MSRVKLAVAVGLLGAVMTASAVAIAGGGGNGGARLSGLEEVPAIITTGEGKLKIRINRSEREIDYRLSYSGLEGGNPTQAHIHIGQRDVNGAIAAFLCGGHDKPPCPPSGTVEGTIDATDIDPRAAAQGVETWEELVLAIRKGVAYANVHTPRWPGGEIRGQLGGRGGDDDKGRNGRGDDTDTDD